MIIIEEFIERNRKELIEIIQSHCENCYIDDEEIEMWINNDEYLYNWAIDDNVDI